MLLRRVTDCRSLLTKSYRVPMCIRQIQFTVPSADSLQNLNLSLQIINLNSDFSYRMLPPIVSKTYISKIGTANQASARG